MSEEEKVKIPSIISVGDLAKKLGVSAASVVAELMKNGLMATINENIDYDTAAIIAEYLGVEVEIDQTQPTQDKSTEKKKVDVKENTHLPERPPFVSILGHVDHGKTALLDKIRDTNVVAGEAGGITQHIGSYQVQRKNKKITFIDTPGHSAFEEMRAHGAQITDIAVVVIAADDGIKTQTLEAINHVKNAHTSLIIAINKIDKQDADPQRILQQMAEIGLVPEEWGGHTLAVQVSAKTGEGIDGLLDLILLLADMKKLRAEIEVPASGVVVESHMDSGKGPVATVLVQNGTLNVGDCVQIGETFGKVRSMHNDLNKRIKSAPPSTPVRLAGIKQVAKIGEFFTVFVDEKGAKTACDDFKKSCVVKSYQSVKKLNLESITTSMADCNVKELALVVKTDVQGSLDAIEQALEKYVTPEVKVRVVHGGVGEVNESDVMMASTASNLIIAFNTSIPSTVHQIAKTEKVSISNYKIIYELLDDVKKAVEELLPPKIIEITLGKLEVLQIFSNAKKATVIGGKVIEGKIDKGAKAKVIRKDELIGQVKITSVRRGKDEIPQAQIGMECGLGTEGDVTILEKDLIVAFVQNEQKQTLDIKI
ncbi:MAG: translation initiation factor IF-2 [bacterium]